ncbi:MAG: hypothetical protein M3Y82_03435 [Verrucomicrobiota bacterium]|nr:hypothetical protein [Verrucomicrobiota bacterium]
MKDEIISEVRKVREQFAADFHYDIKAMCAELKRREKTSGKKFVDLSARKQLVHHGKPGK